MGGRLFQLSAARGAACCNLKGRLEGWHRQSSQVMAIVEALLVTTHFVATTDIPSPKYLKPLPYLPPQRTRMSNITSPLSLLHLPPPTSPVPYTHTHSPTPLAWVG